jgi:starch-binding outer membrane protein, SusD/RagB family
MKLFLKYYTTILVACSILFSCKKQDNFLSAKPDQALLIATTLADYQLLLNNESVLNFGDPGLGTICADDDFYVMNSDWASALAPERNGYIWAKNFYENDAFYQDWINPYNQVYYCNNILEGLSKLQPSAGNQAQFNQIKGSALYFRCYAFYNLVQTFAMPYDSLTANTDLGICIRLSTDFNSASARATVQQSYDQILLDLQTALDLLPATPTVKTQPSKWAANALFARIYLALRNYSKASLYANACLSQSSTLTDYNTLGLSTFNISNTFLEEEIFHTSMNTYSLATRTRAFIDSNLYNSYDPNDLRKTLFFIMSSTGLPQFRGSYDYVGNKFSGLATDEIYLIRAECNARNGNTAAAMDDLNTLMIKRWKNNGSWVPFAATDANDALKKVLSERRKELILRGLRWTDLRRLNKEAAFKKTLTRIINGTTYTLPPNDIKYAVPIPLSEIQLSGIPQNPR